MSGLRMKVAGRFKPCAHMGCFDLEVFVEMNQRSRKWQCPICLKNYSWEKVIIDPYFNRITSKMRDSREDVAEIEVKPDGSWRVKTECNRRGIGELGLWHLPDGTLCDSSEVESNPKLELKPVHQEVGCDIHAALKLGIKKNGNGNWEFRKPGDNGPTIIPVSSSAADSGRDGGEVHDLSTVIDTENESESLTIGPPHGCNAAPAGDAEVIVLSDSEEETEPQVSSQVVDKNDGPVTSGVHWPAGTGNLGESAAANASSLRHEFQSKDGNSSILLGMNSRGAGKTSRNRSDSPSSFPHQERSVRPRVYLSIDSD